MNKEIITGYSQYTITKNGEITNTKTHNIIKPVLKNGYYSVQLKSNNNKIKTLAVHRIVAQQFLPNPNNFPYVNHINGIKTDYHINNLEWMTQKHNINHALKTGLITPHTRSVLQYSLDKSFIQEFDTVNSAAQSVQLSRHSISSVCRGKTKTAGGYCWEYKITKRTESIPLNLCVIIDYPNYCVSKEGEIYSIKQKIHLKPQINKSGYCYVTLCKNKQKRNFYIHRLVAQALIPNIKNKQFVNHIDLNKQNNCVSNLEWVTHSENVLHAYEQKNKNNEKITLNT
jgi:hypothetical protein